VFFSKIVIFYLKKKSFNFQFCLDCLLLLIYMRKNIKIIINLCEIKDTYKVRFKCDYEKHNFFTNLKLGIFLFRIGPKFFKIFIKSVSTDCLIFLS